MPWFFLSPLPAGKFPPPHRPTFNLFLCNGLENRLIKFLKRGNLDSSLLQNHGQFGPEIGTTNPTGIIFLL